MRSVRFVILGRPVPHERVVPKNGGRPFTSRRTRDYETHVSLCAMAAAQGSPLAGETAVSIQLMIWSAQWGDLDNYAKSILDGMVKGKLIVDDKPIRKLTIERDPCAKDQQRAVVCAYEFPRPVAIPVANG